MDVGVIGKKVAHVAAGTWAKIGALGKARGLKWGGDFKNKDVPHFELPQSELPQTVAPSVAERVTTTAGTVAKRVVVGAGLGLAAATLAPMLIGGVLLIGGFWTLERLTRPD